MTTTVYLCRGCTIYLGKLADDLIACENCGHPGPHIPAEVDEADADLLTQGGEHGVMT
jgi:hypothetical protein